MGKAGWIFKGAGEKNNRNKDYQFWQQDNHPMECDTNEILETRLIYLHQNPVTAGLVRDEQDYVYSSGIDQYAEGNELIEIDFVKVSGRLFSISESVEALR